MLITVLVLLLSIAAISLLLNEESGIDVALVNGQAKRETARYVAEAGIQHAIWLARQADCSNYSNLTNEPFGKHSYSVAVTPTEGSPISLQSIGTLDDMTAATARRMSQPIYSTTATASLMLQPGPEGKDAYILVDKPDENRGDHVDLITDSEESGQGPVHALIQFDLSPIPSSTVIVSAVLGLYLYDDSGSGDVVEAHALQRNWVEGVGLVDDGVNWNTSDGSLAWSNPGGDYDPAVAGSFIASGIGWKELDLTMLIQAWVDGSRPNYGVVLLSPPASGNNEMVYRSSDFDTPSRRPKLTVTYSCECGKACSLGIGGNELILSTDSDAELGGLAFLDTDLAEYDIVTDSAALFLDSVAVGLTKKIDALHVLENGNLILSTDADATFGGLSFKSEDLIEYDPVAGTATMFLEADAHFQTKKNVISVHVLDSGNIVLSTDGGATLGGLAFSDKDLVEYNRVTGEASIFFDGDATTLSKKIIAVHIGPNGHIVLTADGDTTLGGLSFRKDQLVDYDPVLDVATLVFDGSVLFTETSEKVTAVHIGAGSGVSPSSGGSKRVLFVVANAGALTNEEAAHRSLIESWGHTVQLIDDNAIQAAFNLAVANNDVVFTTSDIDDGTLGTKLVDASIGIVTSEDYLSDEFGLASNIAWDTGNVIDIDNNTHYITSPFSLGALTVFSSAEPLAYVTGSVSPDLEQLASSPSGSGLVTLEVGASTYAGGQAAGRRVQLPWGGDGFKPDDLSAGGRTILQRALEWGAAGSTCSANFIPAIKLGEFSTSSLGISDPWGIAFLPPGTFFNGETAPAEGAWLLVDGSNRDFIMTDMSGTSLTSTSIPTSEPRGVAPVSSGTWNGHLALANPGDMRVYLLDSNAEIQGSFSTVGVTEHPVGLTFIESSAGGTYDGHLAISSDKDSSGGSTAGIYILTQSGNLQHSIDVSAFAPEPWGIAHVPGEDLFLISDKSGTVYIVDFDGTLHDQYDTPPFDPTSPQAIAINPLNCDHAVLDKDTEKVVHLNVSGGGGGLPTGDTYRDEFNAKTFSGNDGTLTWSTDWTEIGESDGATSGDVQVPSDGSFDYVLRVRDNENGGEGVEREADLAVCSAATLFFDFRRKSFDDGDDYVTVDVSADGGGSWTELDRLSGPADESAYQTTSYDISGAMASDSRIRFLGAPTLGDTDELFVDNVIIVCP